MGSSRRNHPRHIKSTEQDSERLQRTPQDESSKVPRSLNPKTRCHQLNRRADPIRTSRGVNQFTAHERIYNVPGFQRHTARETLEAKRRTNATVHFRLRPKPRNIQTCLPTPDTKSMGKSQ